MLTVGNASDLRYLWPRIVELIVIDQLRVNKETIFAAPRRAGWQLWPEQEQTALKTFVCAVLTDMTTRIYNDGLNEVDSWICAFSQFLDDVTIYLKPLLNDTAAAKANLLSLYDFNARRIARNRLTNVFWEETNPNFRKMLEWFRDPDVVAAVDRAYVI